MVHLSADDDGLTPQQHQEGVELFQTDVAPQLRATVVSRPLNDESPSRLSTTRQRSGLCTYSSKPRATDAYRQ